MEDKNRLRIEISDLNQDIHEHRKQIVLLLNLKKTINIADTSDKMFDDTVKILEHRVLILKHQRKKKKEEFNKLFEIGEDGQFICLYGNKCSVKYSSAAEPALWLRINDSSALVKFSTCRELAYKILEMTE